MIIIPARLKSTRLANKVLCDIGGLPMVVRSAKNASVCDEVVVACDDEEIIDVCKKWDVKCILTSRTHNSGTDRCAEAANILGLSEDEIIINLQADEPFIESSVINALAKLTQNSTAFMNTLVKKISLSERELRDTNLVKVVMNAKNEAIYFSRLGIPFDRDKVGAQYFGHIGIYGFTNKHLQEFCALPKAPLEQIEKLEQLRALYYGKNIALEIVETKSIGIDTLEDLQKAREYMNLYSLRKLNF